MYLLSLSSCRRTISPFALDDVADTAEFLPKIGRVAPPSYLFGRHTRQKLLHSRNEIADIGLTRIEIRILGGRGIIIISSFVLRSFVIALPSL